MSANGFPTVSGVILAGGLARRMGGEDKGLVDFHGQPLIKHVIKRLLPQVDQLLINANRNIDRYQQFGYRVIADTLTDFQGPLAGMLSGMQNASSDYILTAPCDGPLLSQKLRQRMLESLLHSGKTIAVATDGQRLQPVYCLMPRHLQADLETFLKSGERKIDLFFAQYPLAEVDFSDETSCFVNLNHPQDLAALPVNCPLPMLGISAFSGTGKTTLLTKLLPQLRAKGLRVAVIKHAHHRFDIDKPGKDSYQIREAGASQVVVASKNLLALMQTPLAQREEPQLAECLARLDYDALDLVLVEGFKQTNFAKLELHRPSLGKPLLADEDPHIIALATDAPVNINRDLTVLDLNDVGKIAEFIEEFCQQAQPAYA
ncbi:MAG: molybdenum cofactor guanylyltransferase MobA [Methylophaga sp.]|nr:molybdenum cofactor guanylyltransferase MobA [Methylophaga sp.]